MIIRNNAEADLIRLRTREGMAVAARGANSRASNPSCPTGSRRNCGACTTLAITRSATWPSWPRCPARRCTGPSAGRRPPHRAEETPPPIAEGHTRVPRPLSQKLGRLCGNSA